MTADCKEDECSKQAVTRGWCKMHYTRWKRHGDPSVRLPNVADMPTPAGAAHPKWKGNSVGYRAVHERVRRHRGPASANPCAHCGAPARHWAYDHTDPDELTASEGPYSTDESKYIPLCVSCHKYFDLAHLQTSRAGMLF